MSSGPEQAQALPNVSATFPLVSNAMVSVEQRPFRSSSPTDLPPAAAVTRQLLNDQVTTRLRTAAERYDVIWRFPADNTWHDLFAKDFVRESVQRYGEGKSDWLGHCFAKSQEGGEPLSLEEETKVKDKIVCDLALELMPTVRECVLEQYTYEEAVERLDSVLRPALLSRLS